MLMLRLVRFCLSAIGLSRSDQEMGAHSRVKLRPGNVDSCILLHATCGISTAQQHTGSNNTAAPDAIEVVFITMMIDSLIWI